MEAERGVCRHVVHRQEEPCGVAQRIRERLPYVGQLRACRQCAAHGIGRRTEPAQHGGASHQLCQHWLHLRALREDGLGKGVLPQVDGTEHGGREHARHFALPYLLRVALRKGRAVRQGDGRIRNSLADDAGIERRMACAELAHRPCRNTPCHGQRCKGNGILGKGEANGGEHQVYGTPGRNIHLIL